jgi:hypothetical protein
MANLAPLTPIIVFGGLVIAAFWLGGMGMDTAAANRKKQ